MPVAGKSTVTSLKTCQPKTVRSKTKQGSWIAVSILIIFAAVFLIYQIYPYLLFQVVNWQKSFNQQISQAFNFIEQQPQQAGLTLFVVSFLYGVFHAVGPGHGKFILSSYLSIEQAKLPQAMRITLLSALAQGLVAIALVSVLVVGLMLSRSYFNLTVKWVERGSFILMILFGCYWLYQGIKVWRKSAQKVVKIYKIVPLHSNHMGHQEHIHSEQCGCGHKHLPSSDELAKIQDWKSMLLVIFSIGLRPCSGAILVLFLAYTLDLYLWGIFSALVMAAGTGLTLSLFAVIVLVARKRAAKISRWYLSDTQSKRSVFGLKLLLGIILIGFGIILFHGSLIDVARVGLFKR